MVAEADHRRVVFAPRPFAPRRVRGSGTRRAFAEALLFGRDTLLLRTLGAMPARVDAGVSRGGGRRRDALLGRTLDAMPAGLDAAIVGLLRVRRDAVLRRTFGAVPPRRGAALAGPVRPSLAGRPLLAAPAVSLAPFAVAPAPIVRTFRAAVLLLGRHLGAFLPVDLARDQFLDLRDRPRVAARDDG